MPGGRPAGHQPLGGGAPLPGVEPQPEGVTGAGVEDREILGFDLDTTSLRSTTDEFERQVAEAMESSGELAEYVADLESDLDSGIDAVDPQAGADLVGEIESFLRNQD